MARFWIDCFCWDLEDEGIDAALARIKGDLYADDLCVQVHCDDTALRRGRAIGDSRLIRRPAGAHFRPDASHYGATRIRPMASGWMKSRDPFTKIARACESTGLGLRVRASCLRNRALAEKHPMAACVDAFGDSSRHRLCPANPDVRVYVVAMATDLAESYPTRCVELADVTFDSSRYARERTLGFDLGGIARSLQDWCFCPSCRQRAGDHGCDAEAAQSTVRGWIDRANDMGVRGKADDISAEISAALGDDSALRGYADARRDSERSLILAAHAKLGDKLAIPVNDDVEHSAIAPVASESGIRLIARHQKAASGNPVAMAHQSMGGASHVAVRFDAYPPFIDGGPALVAGVHAAVDAGHLEIGFYADGLLPPPCLDWIRQAVRYARRES